MCGLVAFGGWPGRQLGWSNKPCQLQRGPDLSPYEVSDLYGGNVLCQQFDRCWPLPPPLLVGQLAARRRAEFRHTPPTLDFNLGFAPCAALAFGSLLRRMVPRRGHHSLSVNFIVIDVIIDGAGGITC